MIRERSNDKERGEKEERSITRSKNGVVFKTKHYNFLKNIWKVITIKYEQDIKKKDQLVKKKVLLKDF